MSISFDEKSCSNKDDIVKAKQFFPDGWAREKQPRRLKVIFVTAGYFIKTNSRMSFLGKILAKSQI